MTPREQFAAIYAECIIAAMAKDPGAWMDTPATAPSGAQVRERAEAEALELAGIGS